MDAHAYKLYMQAAVEAYLTQSSSASASSSLSSTKPSEPIPSNFVQQDEYTIILDVPAHSSSVDKDTRKKLKETEQSLYEL